MSRSMPRSLDSRAPGSHRVAAPQALPGVQIALRFDPAAAVEHDDEEARRVWREAMGAFGSPDAFRALRCEKPSYLSKINESLTDDERPAQWRWLWTLLADPKAAAVLVPAINARAGYAAPVATRTVTREQVNEALADEVAEMGGLAEVLRERVAKRLGVEASAVKL